MSGPLTKSSILDACERLTGQTRRTPSMEVDASSIGIDVPLLVKLEHLQYSGSFKARGAANFLATTEINDAGVVAASGGNHGAAVAWAAQRAGIRSTIFVPTIASAPKVERLFTYGASVRQIGTVYAESLAASEDFVATTGATPIHAYNDPIAMAGAGTVAVEFEQQVAKLTGGRLDTVLVACGGGGLAGGMATHFDGGTRLVVCETEGTSAYAAARADGGPTPVEISGIAADSLGASQLGSNAWTALSRHPDTIRSAVVDDEAVKVAQVRMWDSMRVAVEPAAATPLAALMTNAYRPEPGERVGIVLCGANTSIQF